MARRLKLLSIAIMLAQAVALLAAVPANAQTEVRYRITIMNLTRGQPFTPPVLALHRRPIGLFEIGSPASLGVQEIAENGNPGPLVEQLEDDRRVVSVVTGSEPIVPANRTDETGFSDTGTFEVDGAGARFLSWESMLICTNDGFTGVSDLRLPGRSGQEITVHTIGYDAGTEFNTEDFADIVPPCQGLIGVTGEDPGTGTTNPALAEGGVVHVHEGIQGGADLIPRIHGWTDPVATLTITVL